MSLIQQSFGQLSRLVLMFTCLFCIFSGLNAEVASAQDILKIGSKAPALNVEHWVSNRDGAFSEVTSFEQDKVYVVEFWATWCGPCIRSMPHLAKLQGEYADKGVQIVSISDEKLSTVEKFLERKVLGRKDQTYADLTNAYCLTTDPDQSVYRDYMEASQQGGIPTAFIVGKSGIVEWIGHPMAMEKPLEKIVSNEWDRDKYLTSLEKEKEFDNVVVPKMKKLVDKNDVQGALGVLEQFIADLDKEGGLYKHCEVIRKSFVIAAGGPEGVKLFKQLAAETDDPERINALAMGIVEQVQAGDEVGEEMLAAACDAAKRAVVLVKEIGSNEGTPLVLDTHAHLLFYCNKLDEAIRVQSEAVELSNNQQLADFYEKLKKAKKEKDS